MNVLRTLAVSLSLYSRIPMPQFQWKEEDMKHVLIFLPVVGAVIGGLVYLARQLTIANHSTLFQLFFVALSSLLPLLITGGFHLDGFMDVCDALRSYGEKEKKLAILKDPHIGAFSVICLLMYALAWVGALLLLVEKGNLVLFCTIFFISRAACGLTCTLFAGAKKDGMLQMERSGMVRSDVIFLWIQLIAGLLFGLWFDWKASLLLALTLFFYTVYYHALCKKQFGGVTGDTAGYYIVMSELWMLIALAAYGYWGV